jgi:hypothetical protein
LRGFAQAILFQDDDEFKARMRELENERRELEAYETAQKEAWYSGRPFPEDEAKFAAYTNDSPRPKQRERINARYREWYWDHSEWRKHWSHARRARELGGLVGNRDAILRVYARTRSTDPIPCHWCQCVTLEADEREVDTSFR